MGTNYNPRIITSGLVLYLDAANTRSYPGSGGTWYDISSRANDGVLTNAPTYNSSNKGNFIFNGSSNYITLNNSLLATSLTTSYTLCSFAKISAVVSKNTILSLNNGNFNMFLPGSRLGPTYQLYWDSPGGWKNGAKTDWTVGQWYYFAWVISVNSLTFYVNAQNNGVTTCSTLALSGEARIGYANASEYAQSSIAEVKVYNRALTATEIQQNYAALRGRFSI